MAEMVPFQQFFNIGDLWVVPVCIQMAEPLPLCSKPSKPHIYHLCQKFCLLYSNESQKSDIVTTNQIKLGKPLRKPVGGYPDTDKHVSKFLFVVFLFTVHLAGFTAECVRSTNKHEDDVPFFVRKTK